MNPLIVLASIGSDLAQTAKSTADQFGWDVPHFIAQVISFSIVAATLYKFAYRPILQVLAARRERIAESLANAEKIQAELAKTEAARQEVLAQANAQANKLIEEARLAATRVLEQETQKAIAAAGQIVAKAKEASDLELARMKNELRREVVRLVADTTGKVTGKILTVEDHRRLAEETNRELAA
jgi:F-type H+-transporting ATPase subunit b